MTNSQETRPWYALTVKPRHEKAVAAHLFSRGLDEYLPRYPARRAWSDRIKTVEMPLFPGYIFCRFGSHERFAVVRTPGVTGVVGFRTADIPVSDAEIATVRAILASGLPVEPGSPLREGDLVRIEEGPLAGVRGRIVRSKGVARLVVNLDLLLRSVIVEVDRNVVGPCPPPSPSTLPKELSCERPQA